MPAVRPRGDTTRAPFAAPATRGTAAAPSGGMKVLRRVPRVAACLTLVLCAYLLAVAAWSWLLAPRVLEAAVAASPLPIEALPPAMLRALLAVEDPAFRSHPGVDPRSPGQGLTTITQALAKLLFLRGEVPAPFRPAQSLFRFVWRATGGFDLGRDVMALVLDRRCDKETQLRLFVNHVYMGELDGRQLVGIGEAARAFFGKQPGELSESEGLALVAMIEAPNGLHPVRHPDLLAERVRRIRRLLRGECRPRGLLDNELQGCA